MSTSPVRQRPTNKRYLGNRNTTEVHDLRFEQLRCGIDVLLRASHGVVFDPDTLTEAHRLRYDNCAHCLGSSTR